MQSCRGNDSTLRIIIAIVFVLSSQLFIAFQLYMPMLCHPRGMAHLQHLVRGEEEVRAGDVDDAQHPQHARVLVAQRRQQPVRNLGAYRAVAGGRREGW